MLDDGIGASDNMGGMMSGSVDASDVGRVKGSFHFKCTDADGKVLWEETDHNLFTTLAKNTLLNAGYNASATLVGPFMGLISSVGFSAVAAADTMASHAGWNEAQGATNVPDYTGNRASLTYGTASAGVITAGSASFVFTSSGTIQGAFVLAGSGAVNTKSSTAGVLMNAGTLSAAQPVISGNTLTITHSGTLT